MEEPRAWRTPRETGEKWSRVCPFTGKDVFLKDTSCIRTVVLALELLRLSYPSIDNGTFGG
jgi:hypothetical protein